ncbi:NitT/TauT family transport system ATP-binding protein/sulfonate transport system ATP-binding protein [Streptohalobacillus salinus]|uniref:NitT/TauT family transport system ATP-binding protein/sulfonate transport system ATP-binding protein n=1 Tax=Streptohalobacillus salinus TaxID=621096 RepID=A0A2V3WVM8_9BACI|nr:ABC transporter ATP-binding protein [Streptohalobacillus salinus]PXW93152.1 NitT/TauT family transport system ATP-binding protein/sulfonate transport system ATP-binding protein [Streptohalobacillus salinus]
MLLELVGLSKAFGQTKILDNIHLEVNEGEVIAFIGTSGCGKSTLLRLIAGLDKSYEGTIKCSGEKVTGVHEDLHVIFQESRLFPWLTVKQNIEVGLVEKNEASLARAERFLGHVGLAEEGRLLPEALSGGMAQRVAIARALVSQPRLLLLDEPFSALDQLTKLDLQHLLQKIHQKYQTTMLLVTHDIEEAIYLADRIVVLKNNPGEIKQVLTVTEPRPRKRTSPSFIKQKQTLLTLLDKANHA